MVQLEGEEYRVEFRRGIEKKQIRIGGLRGEEIFDREVPRAWNVSAAFDSGEQQASVELSRRANIDQRHCRIAENRQDVLLIDQMNRTVLHLSHERGGSDRAGRGD